MVEADFSGNFLNADNCKEGDIGIVLSEGVLEDKENLQKVKYTQLTIEVEVNGKKKQHSPKTMEGQNLQRIWGKDSKIWIGKQFTCKIVNYRSYGQPKTCVEIVPLTQKV
jgi:hypothetical protein